MRIRREDWARIAVVALLSAPAFAFMTFDFVFPNVSWPSLDRNMLVAFLLSILFSMPAGYLIRKTDLALLSGLLNVFLGYVLALVTYGAPFILYDFSVVFPDLYFMFFIRMTVVLALLMVLGSFVGVILGQMIGDASGKEETAQSFPRPGQ